MKDLIVLVPDRNTQYGIGGLFSRYQALNIREISYKIVVHPLHDPGVYNDAANFLRPFSTQYSYTLVFLDYEGSGQEEKIVPGKMAKKIKKEIEQNGWLRRVEVIVFEPELEKWVWIESSYTAKSLGWSDYSELKKWLTVQKLWEENTPKPKRPKEALERCLEKVHVPRSSSIYLKIAHQVNFNRCQDSSFGELKCVLQKWFPIEK